MITSITLVFCLVVGVAGVRIFSTGNTEISFDSSYSELLNTPSVNAPEIVALSAPEMSFSEIKIPVAPRVVALKRKPVAKKITVAAVRVMPVIVHSAELPFQEPVKLQRIQFEGDLLVNIASLYQDISVEEKVLVAEIAKEEIKDEVKTVQSAEKVAVETSEAEPDFFDYAEKSAPVEEAAVVAAVPEKTQINNVQIINEEVSAPAPKKEVVQENNLIAFDYAAMNQDVEGGQVPTVTMVDSHKKGHPSLSSSSDKFVQQEENTQPEKGLLPKSPVFNAQMTILGMATDLKHTDTISSFEVRFQDNNSEIIEDYGDGEVTLSVAMAHPKMTRSMVLLKRGFAPTNTDLILEDGASRVSLPVIAQEQFDELLNSFESQGPIGAVLVELSDETELAQLDVPFGKVLTLDGDMKETQSEDFRYQLFLGVKAGNTLLTYVHGNEKTSKIIHVHEHELTYESNFYEKENLNKVSLYQEDLLSREKSPLIIASENVRVFATNSQGEKLNQNTYKIDFGRKLLGGRNYLELTHEAEPVFIGTSDIADLSVPTESFMRHVLSSLPDNKLGNRCSIQINVKRPVSEVMVAAESVGDSLMTTSQYLDADGKFYDSASEKTRKVIVFGENQNTDSHYMDGKVNVRINYIDGSTDFLGTYCSPNSYLVEQL